MTMTDDRHVDDPIADPAERAEAVARILRGRGIWAEVDSGVAVSVRRLGGHWYSMRADGFDLKGPRAIADAIQAEEARRAQRWAGDPMTDAITYELETLDDGTVAVYTISPIGNTAREVMDQLHRDRASGAIAIPDGARVMIMGPRKDDR